MEQIVQAQRAIRKHFPRNHLFLAGGLALILIAVTVLLPDESAHGDRLYQQSVSEELSAATAQPVPTPAVPDGTRESLPVGPQLPENYGWTELTVAPGDTLSSIFTKVGLSAQELHRVVSSSDSSSVLNRLHPGYQLGFFMPEEGQLNKLQVLTSPLEGFVFTRHDTRFEVEPIQRTPEILEVIKQGEIADSLFMAAQRADIPANIIMDMADIFGGVIDFLLDPRQGDQFSIIYQEKYLDGEYIGPGEIIGAQFINRGREHVAVHYENAEGESGFFSPDGESMQKAFLRNPLDVFRISSNFNPNRRHPILNTIRAHKGTDYAAPTGTPVRATADGTVTWAARNGSFGNLVVIQHRGSYETKYAHLNSYAKGIRKGSKVTQGQVIGYVGATGSATGPHLHYEFLVAGVHKDPRTIVDQLPQAVTLAEAEMPRFRAHTDAILERFRQSRPDGRLLSMAMGPVPPAVN
ncbi:peptidoglycan DD-metalloendopeptidase family protein [Pseudohongiella spirulinae]|uniref:Metalloendopeptidase-like membrain protein n=1 Tax=Pseudohongiella spirulinae TaxID=1249552 RepID=A0A0S2KGM4_9GAMM|nr:peptidoglycan DD-metalloendopeptidase family protein [Pseudohongiella spirulinae]ALO47119.1 metalloendopeptidase-like membrain protein [Pseudohongiella spirulinae]